MIIIGITGTNGKTTITHVVDEILTKAGYKVGKIGTLTGRLTTPSPWELSEQFEKFRTEGKDFVVMEVSSHGIHQDRIKGIYYHIKCLTNITQDHLDYHKTFSEYRRVKLSWMKQGNGIKIYPKDYQKIKLDFSYPYIGHFNENNIKAAYAILQSLNILPEPELKTFFKELSFVPGRFEVIDCGQPFKVIVDYAHTPDGLINVVKTARGLLKKQKAKGKLITLFGCGGDRDKGKRPKMGHIAHRYSDMIIITSDNPRSENPEEIIKDIIEGVHPLPWEKKSKINIEIDRKKAIPLAISKAQPGDIVLLAGKGHETYQIVGNERHHLDDREEARSSLKKLKR